MYIRLRCVQRLVALMSREEVPSFSTNKDGVKSWPTSFHYDTVRATLYEFQSLRN